MGMPLSVLPAGVLCGVTCMVAVFTLGTKSSSWVSVSLISSSTLSSPPLLGALEPSPGGGPDPKAIRASARELLRLGVRRLVCIHMPEGGYALAADGKEYWQPSLALPEGYIKGGAGAGDAFCSGVLYGLHERWDLERSLKLGVSAAAVCLSDPTCTAAACSLADTMKLAEKYAYRPAGL